MRRRGFIQGSVIGLMGMHISPISGMDKKLPNRAVILLYSNNQTLVYAKEELKVFLRNKGGLTINEMPIADTEEAWRFSFKVDTTMKPYSFSVDFTDTEHGPLVHCAGPDPACVLHAVYTLLEQVGYQFEITGPIVPDIIEMEKLIGWETTVNPNVNNRGIRQHLNFPMDISSYPIEEAKEYIRNLARMRFNCITFHSYSGQWIEITLPEKKEYAGAFFYGQRYDIPNVPLFKKNIRNKRVFCIPEIEPFYDDRDERSKRAVMWLQKLMKEAKKVGLSVRLSFEPQETGVEVDTTVIKCEEIIKLYPDIDVLELFTSETGEFGENRPVHELREVVVKHFGEEILNKKEILSIIEEDQRELHRLFGQIGHMTKTIGMLKKRWVTGYYPRLCVGVYCTVEKYLEASVFLLRRYVPDDVGIAIMPGYGSRRVARHIEKAGIIQEDWQRLMVYSWIEFDGIMYLQQNSIHGIHQLMDYALQSNGNSPIEGFCFNHWRTAENRISARYASLTTILGQMDEGNFYREYALMLGIGSPDTYSEAMTALGESDNFSAENIFNIGFCYVGCWYLGGPLGYFGEFNSVKIHEALLQYNHVRELIGVCAKTTIRREGREYISFLDNRLRFTIMYLKAIDKGLELQKVCKEKKPENLTNEERIQVVRICNQALVMLDQCMELHAEALVDRGCEGTLISIYHTPPAVLKKLRYEYGGVAKEEVPKVQEAIEPPPSPVQFHNE